MPKNDLIYGGVDTGIFTNDDSMDLEIDSRFDEDDPEIDMDEDEDVWIEDDDDIEILDNDDCIDDEEDDYIEEDDYEEEVWF